MTPKPGRAKPWLQRDFRIAWAAGFINNTGDWVLLVALPVYVFVETGSGRATALLFVAQVVAGGLMGPIGGALVDRWDLKHSLVATNLAQAVAVLPLLGVAPDRIWPAYVVMAMQSTLKQINDPANVALLPRVVPTDELTTANAALSGAESTARLLGAPLGGILVAWGGLTPVVIVDALSFLFVALTLLFLTADTSPRATGEKNKKMVREGIRIVRSHPPLLALLSINALSQVAQGGFVILFVAFVVETLGDDGVGLGFIRGAMAVGALVGAAFIARLSNKVQSTTLFSAGLLGLGAASLLFWNAPAVTTTLWVYVLLFSLSGLPGSAISVGLFTTFQTTSPPDALGRVAGIGYAAGAIGVAAGSILTSLLIDSVNLRVLLNMEATIHLAAGLLALFFVRLPDRGKGC